MADADAYQPSVSTLEHADNIIYYRNGTIACGPATGALIVTNPAHSSPLSAVNITLPNGTVAFIGRIDPSSGHSINYSLPPGEIENPLKLAEAISPSSLTRGTPGQLRLYVEIENAGSSNIIGFTYQKPLPPGLSVAWTSGTGGSLNVNGTVTWTLDTLSPGERKNIVVALDLTPSGGVYFQEAYIEFAYGESLTGNAPGFEGNTNTSFRIQKSNPGAGQWRVEASIPDDSEFTINLKNVTIYRSSAADPFATSAIASYVPDIPLDPGQSWNTTLNDRFDTVPAYFIKTSYSLPYTLDQAAVLRARTEPIAIDAPPPYPYNPLPPMQTGTPTMPPPAYNPDIVFIRPEKGEIIKNNTTELVTSIPPYRDPGYVVYYGSSDNKTWTRLGESPIEGNISRLAWTVPGENGNYYLKAEHYDARGLRGTAYVNVLIAFEITPVDITTKLASGMSLLMLLLAFIALILVSLILMPYFTRRT